LYTGESRGNIYINLTSVIGFEVFMFLYSFIKSYLSNEPYSMLIKFGSFVVATGAFIDFISNFSKRLDFFEEHNVLHNILLILGSLLLIMGVIHSLHGFYEQKFTLKSFISAYDKIDLNASKEDFLKTLLIIMINSIPGAKKGSVIVLENNHYVFKVAKGYDIEQLKKIEIEIETFPDIHLKNVLLIKNIQKRFDRFPNEILQKLIAVQDNRIKSTIVIPAKNEEIFFYIDFEKGVPSVKGSYGDLLESMRIFTSSLIEKYEMYQSLKQIYDKDPLTKVYSRAGIDSLLKNTENNPKGNVLIILDLDGFKKVNDSYGHQVGDEYLRFFVEELRRKLRSNDIIVRFGGDEFLILMENCIVLDALEKMKNITEEFKKLRFYVRDSNVLIPISFSYGMATIRSANQFDQAVTRADRELYEMKEHKKLIMKYKGND